MADDSWLSAYCPGIVGSSLTVRDTLTRGTTICMADDLWLTYSHTPVPTLRIATIAQSQGVGSGQTQRVSVSYTGMSASQSDCRNRCLWLINSFDCGHKVENITLPYCLLQTPQTSWKLHNSSNAKVGVGMRDYD